jgi:hypothetical protein
LLDRRDLVRMERTSRRSIQRLDGRQQITNPAAGQLDADHAKPLSQVHLCRLRPGCQNDFATEFATVGKLSGYCKPNGKWELRPKKIEFAMQGAAAP